MALTHERISLVLKKISKPHTPFNKDSKYRLSSSKKVAGIVDAVKNNFSVIVDERYGVIVSSDFNNEKSNNKKIKEKLLSTEVIVISHIDLIKPFNTEKTLSDLKDQFSICDEDSSIVGALDNTLTNAILLSVIKTKVENFNNKCDDIMILFSIGEEKVSERGFKESSGVKNFVKKFHKEIKTNNIKVINLDVTADEYHEYYEKNQKESFDKDTTPAFIEYDKFLKKDRVEKLNYSPLKSLNSFAKTNV